MTPYILMGSFDARILPSTVDCSHGSNDQKPYPNFLCVF